MNSTSPSPSAPLRLTTLSGHLLLSDWFTWTIWSGDAPPVLSRDVAESEQMWREINESSDWEILGPDAQVVGSLLDEQGLKTHLLDIPAEAEAWLHARFQQIVEQHGLDAHLEQVTPRLSHRQRAELVLAENVVGGEVIVHGSPAVATTFGSDSVVLDVKLLGAPVPNTIELRREGASSPVAFRSVGCVLPQDERLVVLDLERACDWQEKQSVQFAPINLDAHDEGHHHHHHEHESEDAWSGVTVRMLTGDGRSVLVAEVGDAAVVPVSVGVDESGQVVVVRLEVPEDEEQQASIMAENWPRQSTTFAIVSNDVWEKGNPACFLHRDPPKSLDSGWCIYSGEETQAYCDLEENFHYVPLSALVHRDPSLRDVFTKPPGTAFSRHNATASFEPLESWQPDDD